MWASAAGRDFDAAVDGPVLLPTLLRRAGDTNAFLSDAAGSALEAVLANAGDARLLSGLLAASSHAHPGVRAKAAPFLARLVASLPPTRRSV